MVLQTRRVGRNELWWLADGKGGHGDEPATVDKIEASIAGKFRLVAETGGAAGLRAPQLGALHAILAAQSIGSAEPATVVLRTGTGKTETMLAVYCHHQVREFTDQASVIVATAAALSRYSAEALLAIVDATHQLASRS